MTVNIKTTGHFKSVFKYTKIFIIFTTAIILSLFAIYIHHVDDTLGKSEIVSGYVVFFLILFLISLRTRKYLSVIPIFKVRAWIKAHYLIGASCVITYFIHTVALWPEGFYEQVLALLFYMTVLTGVLGYLMQSIFPRRLTETGIEYIYERIPNEIAEIRKEVELIIIDCARETNSGTLGRHYLESLDWYFLRPRFLLNHILGGQKAQQWIEHHFLSVKRYLNNEEATFLEQLLKLAHKKNKVDFHYALQGCMKIWLFIHIPVAIALLILILWHLLLINIYSI